MIIAIYKGSKTADWGDCYDRIILDAPPHYGFADILVLSQRVDGFVLVGNMVSTTCRPYDISKHAC